jgi:hypothetical protein
MYTDKTTEPAKVNHCHFIASLNRTRTKYMVYFYSGSIIESYICFQYFPRIHTKYTMYIKN